MHILTHFFQGASWRAPLFSFFEIYGKMNFKILQNIRRMTMKKQILSEEVIREYVAYLHQEEYASQTIESTSELCARFACG